MILGVDIDQQAASERREQQSSSSGWAPGLIGRVRALPYYPALTIRCCAGCCPARRCLRSAMG